MNKLPLEIRVQILNLLVEGSSLGSISRVTGVSINTVTKLLVDAGHACAAFHDANVRKVGAQKVQCDEIWSFCYATQRNVADAEAAPDGAGNVWTFTAIEPDSQLMVSWMVGGRNEVTAYHLMCDLKGRLTDRMQLTTDGFPAYLGSEAAAFGRENADYGMLVKIYGQPKDRLRGSAEWRRSQPECIGCKTSAVYGGPHPDHVSYVERQNLTMRMLMRRLTPLTNTFTKRFENHCHSLALYFCRYNWMQKHKSVDTTPAIAAKIADKALTMADIAALVDARDEHWDGDIVRMPASSTPIGSSSFGGDDD
jgi:IS1 family transposase